MARAVKPDTRNLRLIYCATACKQDWRKKYFSAKRKRHTAGQRYAEEISPGVWMCLCCGGKV